jgi:lipopolysaccharide transport system permease protein
VASKPITIIEARPQSLSAQLASLWQYRGFYGFLFREITMKKFRDTFLGFWWLILRPLIPAAVFITLFTVVRPQEGSEELPYPLFYLSGFITWNLFHSTVIFMPRTLLWMRGIMRRTYFPRLLVPLAGFGPPLIEFVVLVTGLVLTVVFYWVKGGHFPLRLGWEMLWLLPCPLAALLLGVAVGMVASVVALFFRDVVFSMSYLVQMLMFLTPVIYPVSIVPESYRWLLYSLNPMAKLVEVSRWALTGEGEFDPFFFFLSIGTVLVLLLGSVVFFLRAETHLADQM